MSFLLINAITTAIKTSLYMIFWGHITQKLHLEKQLRKAVNISVLQKLLSAAVP